MKKIVVLILFRMGSLSYSLCSRSKLLAQPCVYTSSHKKDIERKKSSLYLVDNI